MTIHFIQLENALIIFQLFVFNVIRTKEDFILFHLSIGYTHSAAEQGCKGTEVLLHRPLQYSFIYKSFQ